MDSSKKSRKGGTPFSFGLVVAGVAGALVLLSAADYVLMPVLAWNFAGWQLLPLALALGWTWRLQETRRRPTWEDEPSEKAGPSIKNPFWATVGVASIWLLFVLASSLGVFHAKAYRQILGTPTQEGPALPKLNIDSAPLVSRQMALQEAQKLLSQQPGLGSQVEIGVMAKQVVNGNLVWVGFLEHSGVIKWMANGSTPGYVVVSATDPANARLVTGFHLRYLESGLFWDNVERVAYFADPFDGQRSFTPELDENGRPFWVVTLYQHEVGFAGDKAIGVLTVDAQTGRVTRYALSNLPAWIDLAQSPSILADEVNNWGRYVHGWLNAEFGGKDVVGVAGKLDLLYGDNGRAYWFAGLSSVGADNGNTGFMLLDSRTGKAYQYQLAGASQAVAQTAVEGLVRANQYHATNPLVFLVQGEPTYVMTLTDATGIVRGYGLVSVKNYQVAVFAPNLADAVRAYGDKLHENGFTVNQFTKTQHAVGAIERKGIDIRGGNSVYYLWIQGVAPLLTGTSDISQELPVLQAGDTVSVGYAEGKGRTAALISLKVVRFQASGK